MTGNEPLPEVSTERLGSRLPPLRVTSALIPNKPMQQEL